MNFKKIKHIHFIGIGGSGMIGIARVLLKKGTRCQDQISLKRMN